MKETVWLVNGWSVIPHSIDGKMNGNNWLTKCGLKIQELANDDRVIENGVLICWDLLNPEKMDPCRKCYREREK